MPHAEVFAIADPDQTTPERFDCTKLREGTTPRIADQLADTEADLGAPVSPLGFHTITANVDSALALMANELCNRAFPALTLARLKVNTRPRLAHQKDEPQDLAGRVAATVIYDAGQPYARAVRGAREVAPTTREDLRQFYNAYYNPPIPSLVVASDVTPDHAVAQLVGGDRTAIEAKHRALDIAPVVTVPPLTDV